MKTVVISGSASLQGEVEKWVSFWKSKGFQVLNWPQPIQKEKFLEEYPVVHKDFYKSLESTDILFIANENKGDQMGYVGNGVFAEIAFAVGLNFVREKRIEVILYQEVSEDNKFFPDIHTWIREGWLSILNTDRGALDHLSI